jgi:hypothetical protein
MRQEMSGCVPESGLSVVMPLVASVSRGRDLASKWYLRNATCATQGVKQELEMAVVATLGHKRDRDGRPDARARLKLDRV